MGADRRGLVFFLGTMLIFATQDGVSKLLAEEHSPIMVVMIRFWAFAAFVIALSAARPGGVRGAARTRRPAAQAARGVLLSFQIMLITYSFAELGLAETHAVNAVYPLLIAAFGALLLGERIALAQWTAIGLGFAGVLVLMAPGGDVFDPLALLPLVCAVMFAVYSTLTRWVSRYDAPAVSFFYTGVVGAIGSSLVGPFFWSAMSATEWMWMALLCVLGVSGHFMLIKAYEHSEAGGLQPFAYLQLVAAALIGVVFFREALDDRLILGAAIVISAGLFALLWRRAPRP